MGELYGPLVQLIGFGCGAVVFALVLLSFAAYAAGRWFD